MTINEKKKKLLDICCEHTACNDECPIYPLKSAEGLCTFDEHFTERVYGALYGKDSVNHPEHYSGKHECIELMRVMFGDDAVKAFCRCNSFKYRFRAARKGGEEDIRKAEWYEDYLFRMINE